MRVAGGVVARVLVFDSQFQARAIRELPHVLTVEFLPGRLVGQVGLFPILFAPREFFFADEHVDRACVEVESARGRRF